MRSPTVPTQLDFIDFINQQFPDEIPVRDVGVVDVPALSIASFMALADCDAAPSEADTATDRARRTSAGR